MDKEKKEIEKVMRKVKRDLRKTLRNHFSRPRLQGMSILPDSFTLAGVVFNQTSPGQYCGTIRPVVHFIEITVNFPLFNANKPPSPQAVAWEERWHKK